MTKEQFKPTDHFVPEQWSHIYCPDNRNGFDFVFRRGADLVYDICSRAGHPGQLWLDIGCGTGDFAALLIQTGRAVIGIDHDPAMITLARKRFANKLKFLAADAYNLPFESETINGVTATSLAGCLERPGRFYSEIYRVLRKDGFAVITFTNRKSILLKINGLIRKMTFRADNPAQDDFLCRLYKCDSVISALQETGFRVVGVKFYNFLLNFGRCLFPPKPAVLYLERLGKFRFSRRLGRNFIITAQKK